MPLKLTPAQKKKVFHLPVEQAVFIPSTMGIDKQISKAQMRKRIKEVETYFSKRFGGFTAVSGNGGFFSTEKNKLIKEPVVEVTSFATEKAFKNNKQDVLRKMSAWSKMWGQEAIGYEHEGDLYFIEKGLPRKRKAKLKARLRKRK